ncbi:MAG: hypothetical protein LBU83_12760 [Bacteroidales bacterium]|jgi:hypothetical protein|nr:hypothetical protein [Bacteroidales bacterium]
MNVIVKENSSANQGQLYYYYDGEKWCQAWEDKFDACRMTMNEQSHELEEIRQKVMNGELSNIAFYACKNLLSTGLLSSYTEIPKRHIKRHLKPKFFNQLDEETLKKYATAFGISVEDLKKI